MAHNQEAPGSNPGPATNFIMNENTKTKPILNVLDEVEPYLEYLLNFVRETRTLVQDAGEDPKAWEELIPVINVKCKEAIPFVKINLGQFLLHLNARCSNMTLVLEDTADNQVSSD